jgi:hypothetical protein
MPPKQYNRARLFHADRLARSHLARNRSRTGREQHGNLTYMSVSLLRRRRIVLMLFGIGEQHGQRVDKALQAVPSERHLED